MVGFFPILEFLRLFYILGMSPLRIPTLRNGARGSLFELMIVVGPIRTPCH